MNRAWSTLLLLLLLVATIVAQTNDTSSGNSSTEDDEEFFTYFGISMGTLVVITILFSVFVMFPIMCCIALVCTGIKLALALTCLSGVVFGIYMIAKKCCVPKMRVVGSPDNEESDDDL